MKRLQQSIKCSFLLALHCAPMFGSDDNPITSMLTAFETQRPQVIEKLNGIIKERRGGIDTWGNKIGNSIEWLAANTATGDLVAREQSLDKLNEQKTALATITDFSPLLQSLTDAQLLFLSESSTSWEQNKPRCISERTEKSQLGILRTLPDTLQHERLFNIRYIPFCEKAQQIPLLGRLIALFDCKSSND